MSSFKTSNGEWRVTEDGAHAARYYVSDGDYIVAVCGRLKESAEQIVKEHNSYKVLLSAVKAAVENNGGPTSTLEGTDTHVLVDHDDFNELCAAIALVEGKEK